ncbi:succinate dehydrogenase cytochrome b560 subunit, mitochondrial-like [Oscarella lobularis]|uniref:succinate dehydrogenase cytochrome b560 subunit, mitochondrial-like n=1 Tax=Oscarella lobularis TaxID=121494 RepID=UPI0033136952
MALARLSRGSLYQPFQALRCCVAFVPRSTGLATDANTEPFFEKNRRLGRPLSPHLTIYKWELNMNMSLFHRITGTGLSLSIAGLSAGYLFVRDWDSVVTFFQGLHLPHWFVIVPGKFLVAWIFAFHSFNGLRHLSWDFGQGFSKPTMKASAWTVAAISGLVAAFLASY